MWRSFYPELSTPPPIMTTTKATKKRTPRFPRLPKGPNGGIQLMLIQNVEHLGKAGDIVEVKPGHANNYLLPEGLAIISNEHHKRMVEKHRAKLVEIERKRLSDLRVQADQISKQSINVEANANEEGHLYGSVGATEIVAALKANGYAVVPVEPTDKICEAGLFANDNALLMGADCTDMRNAYRAMIAAASTQHDDGGE